MNNYTTATKEELERAMDMADYDIQRFAKTNPLLVSAARLVKVKFRDELKRRFSHVTK